MSFVLDASIALSWCFQDESTPETMILLDKVAKEDVFVPALWSLEIGNILLGAQRKGRISSAHILEYIHLIESLEIQIDCQLGTRGLYEILNLATTQHLTTYDAAYLELAMRLGISLATKDKQLQKAAESVGVQLM